MTFPICWEGDRDFLKMWENLVKWIIVDEVQDSDQSH